MGGGKAGVYPEKCAYLAVLAARSFLHESLFIYQDYFAGSEEFYHFKTGIGKGACFGGHCPGILAFSDYKRRIAEAVSGSVHAILIEKQEGARTVNHVENLLYAVNQVVAAAYELGNKLRSIDPRFAYLAE